MWDRLFGSLRQRERPDEIRLGLDAFDDDAFQSVAGMLRTPLVPDPTARAGRRPSP